MADFDMMEVNSSNLAAVGYDQQEQELRVDFKDGGSYIYSGVSPQEFETLMRQPSIGSWFYRNIRMSKSYRTS